MKISMCRAAVLVAFLLSVSAKGAEQRPLVVAVMDPLSARLACDCVKGYAQRKYERLGVYLEESLGRGVEVVWAESLANAVTEADGREPDIVIGKHSVVLTDAKQEKWQVEPIASLTGKDGKTTQTGLIVVRKDSPAKSAADLKGYRLIFGPADCDEKSAAAIALFHSLGVDVKADPETAATCSLAAACLMDLPTDEHAAAVISSYAEPLLAGCGTINKGDLRVIAETAPVPFITVFANGILPSSERDAVRDALLRLGKREDLLAALETKEGFVAYQDVEQRVATKKK